MVPCRLFLRTRRHLYWRQRYEASAAPLSKWRGYVPSSQAVKQSPPRARSPSKMMSTGTIREARSSMVASGPNSDSCTSLPPPSYQRASTRSMLVSPPRSPSRSGGRTTPPVKPEMSITEQIARQTRKSTVLDPKNALLIMAIPDYDDYKIMQPYSCRSLSNKSKFVGGRDFITRHNPQEVNEFKKQFSREVGNLNRHRSIVAPPTSNLAAMTLLSSSSQSIGLLAPVKNGNNNNLQDNTLWRKTFTSGMKACWVLTVYGLQTLIGPEFRLTTRTPVLPALPSPRPQRPPILSLSCRSPGTAGRPETSSSLSVFSARESARIGVGVDLTDEKTLAALSRLALNSPKPRTPSYSPAKRLTISATKASSSNSESSASTPTNVTQMDRDELISLAPYADISWERNEEYGRERQQVSQPDSSTKKVSGFHFDSTAAATSEQRLPVVTVTTQKKAMEVSPPSLSLGTLQTGQVYLFPVRVRNVGSLQERFRVIHVAATCAGFAASIAEANYQRESARLAPGLAAIVTVALSFNHPGRITGSLRVEAEGLGPCDVEIKGVVRNVGK